MRRSALTFKSLVRKANMSTTAIPNTIRSIFQPDLQKTDLVLTRLPIQLAKPGTEEHLIKVIATAPCAGELLWHKNFFPAMDKDKADIPGYDISGVVATAPANSPFQPGTEVYTRTSAMRTGNGREYGIALTSELAAKPKTLSWEESASIGVSALTAYQALFEHGGLKLGWKDAAGRRENASRRMLVTAGAGGVGTWVLQLAKAAGVGEIVAVTGPDNIDFVKSLGATEIINYKEQSLGAWAAAGNKKADVIIDMLGGKMLADAWFAVKEGGTLLSIRELPESQKPTENAPEITHKFFILNCDGTQLGEIGDLLDSGKAKPIIDSVWKFEEFKEAFAKVEGGHARGKVVIRVQE